MTQIQESHPAIVTAIEDPEQRGRIRVSCPALTGDTESLPMWVVPVTTWGWFFVPDIGESVEVIATTGSSDDEQPGQSSIHGLNLRWRGGRYWTKGEGTPVHDDFKENYGKRRGFVTPAGHVMVFDDTKSKKQINMMWKGDKEGDYAYQTFNPDGSIVMGNKNGTMIYMNAKDRQFAIIDEHGNNISTSADGITIVDKNSNMIVIGADGIQVSSQKDVAIQAAGTVSIDSVVLQECGDSEKAIKGTTFMALFKAHTHPTGMGPSGPPVDTGFDTSLSDKVKLG